MTILQQPDALSLSMNLKKFILGSAQQVSFVLKQGEKELVAQRYDPDTQDRIEIDVRDIVHASLSVSLQDTGEVYLQTSLAADFTALIDTTEVTFRVVRGGVDRLADSATNFLTQNWLTWQPSVKPVTYYSPELLTYYAVVAGSVKLCASFTDATGTVESQTELTLAQLSAGNAYTVPLQYSIVVGKLDGRKPAWYDVWVEDASGLQLTYLQRYYADASRSRWEDWVLFENSLGGIDTFRAYGSSQLEAAHTHNIAEIEEEQTEYRVDTERKWQKNTGHLTPDEARWLLDFFPSPQKYIYTGNCLRRIVVVESSVSGKLREQPANYTFTYQYADARPLLNLPRTDTPADLLDITVPDVGSFTIPPRLAEFPRLPLSEGALFPVQDPYSESWSATTMAAIASLIGQLLAAAEGSGGGVGHTHGNIDLLNLLSWLQGYLLVNGEKIKAGYADMADVADLARRLETDDFRQGSTGVGIYQDSSGNWHIETDYVDVRLKFTAKEAEIQRYYHISGAQIKSAASMKCVRVEELAEVYRCYMNIADDEGNEVSNDFKAQDQAYVQTFNLTKQADGSTGNHFLWRLVVAVGNDYIDLSKTVCAAGSDAPKAGDSIVQLGYRGTDDATRQNAVIDAGAGTGSPYYRQYVGINTFTLPEPETQLKPGDNELAGRLHIQPGSTGWRNMDGLPEEIQDAADLAADALTEAESAKEYVDTSIGSIGVGSVNLLRNSSFLGDYKDEELEATTTLTEESELYSKALKHWSGMATVQDDAEATSGKSAVIGSLSQSVTLISNESYIISYKAKGTSLAVSCGDYSVSQPLTSDYRRYTHKLTFAGAGVFLISGTATVCDLQLERGTIATDWKPSPLDNDKAMAEMQSVRYLADAIKNGSVDILGGLILATMIQLGNYKDGAMRKVTAGMSGIYNDDDDVYTWGGGTFGQAIRAVMMYRDNPRYQPTEEELKSIAKIVLTHGGRAILNDVILRGYVYALGGVFKGAVQIAGGKILLNEDGSGSLADGSLYWDEQGTLYRKRESRIIWRNLQAEGVTAIDPALGNYIVGAGVVTENYVFTLPVPSASYTNEKIVVRGSATTRLGALIEIVPQQAGQLAVYDAATHSITPVPKVSPPGDITVTCTLECVTYESGHVWLADGNFTILEN